MLIGTNPVRDRGLRGLLPILHILYVVLPLCVFMWMMWDLEWRPFRAEWECNSQQDYDSLVGFEYRWHLDHGYDIWEAETFCAIARECPRWFNPSDFDWQEFNIYRMCETDGSESCPRNPESTTDAILSLCFAEQARARETIWGTLSLFFGGPAGFLLALMAAGFTFGGLFKFTSHVERKTRYLDEQARTLQDGS
jgi:hypothetical protein